MHSYGEAVARHYAAYRPPLHRVVLARALDGQQFSAALDIGCGTGQSSLALVPFADQITGVDNSPEMLGAALPHAAVRYAHGSEHGLPGEAGTVDLVTLAGVMPYMDRAALGAELRRLCRPGAVVLPFDFRVDLEPLLSLFWPDQGPRNPGYDYRANLAGVSGFMTEVVTEATTAFDLDATDAAHMVLARETRFAALSERAGSADATFGFVRQRLVDSGFAGSLTARLFWSVHRYTG